MTATGYQTIDVRVALDPVVYRAWFLEAERKGTQVGVLLAEAAAHAARRKPQSEPQAPVKADRKRANGGRPRQWTPTRVATLMQMRRDAYTAREIAAVLGVSENAVNVYVSQNGLSRGNGS